MLAPCRRQLVAAVALAQAAINAVFDALFAIIAEEVPCFRRKGLAGGLLALGNPVAAGSRSCCWPRRACPSARFVLVPLAAATLALPLLAATRKEKGDPEVVPPRSACPRYRDRLARIRASSPARRTGAVPAWFRRRVRRGCKPDL